LKIFSHVEILEKKTRDDVIFEEEQEEAPKAKPVNINDLLDDDEIEEQDIEVMTLQYEYLSLNFNNTDIFYFYYSQLKVLLLYLAIINKKI
jgi:hypothetical protein